jgi:hypothetical protein
LHGYLIHIAEQAEAAHRNGLSSAEAAETIDLGEYATCLDAERVVVNIYQRYRELDLPNATGCAVAADDAAEWVAKHS